MEVTSLVIGQTNWAMDVLIFLENMLILKEKDMNFNSRDIYYAKP